MKFIAVLRASRELERPKQSFNRTKQAAGEWASDLLKTEPKDSTVEIFEIINRKVATVKHGNRQDG